MIDIINGNKIYLRKFQSGDEAYIFRWKKDPDVSRFLTWYPEKDISESVKDLNKYLNEYNDPKNVRFAIVYKENDEVIGSINVCRFHDEIPEVGYVLAKAYWDKGFMSESLSLLLKHLEFIGYKKVLIHADIFNVGSNLVIIKNGFKYVKRYKTIFEENKLKCVLNEYELISNTNKPKIYKVKVNKETFEKMIHSTNKDLVVAINEKLNISDYILIGDEKNHNAVFSLLKVIERNKNNDSSLAVELLDENKYPKRDETNLVYLVNFKIVLIY